MRTVLPGKPQAKLQAVCTGLWGENQLIAYITGNAIVILNDPSTILQTIYDEDASPLTAVSIDEATGKIVACTERSVRVYRPYGQDEGALQWSLQGAVEAEDNQRPITTLSWGGAGELLVGNSKLALYTTEENIERIWSKPLASPTKFAALSYNSEYISSTGVYDRFVKLWRRLSFGSGDVRFDLTYLPHPQAVTSIRWRRPYHLDQTVDNVLYTVSADQVLRIWAATDPHGLRIFQLWGQIDLKESIQPRSMTPTGTPIARYVFMIDFRDFSKAAEKAVEAHKGEEHSDDAAVGHLVEVANRSPEICVVLDDQGHMSAWGMENIGMKERKSTDIFNVAHVTGLLSALSQQEKQAIEYAQFATYCDRKDGKLNILLHKFDGTIDCLESDLAHLFDLKKRVKRLRTRATWTGHSAAVKKIVRNNSGRAVVSRTDDNETIVWRHNDKNGFTSLKRASTIDVKEHIHRICVIRRGNFVVLLHHSEIALWDCRQQKSKLLGSVPYAIKGKPLCVLILPEIGRDRSVAHIATISSEMKGIVWELNMPPNGDHDQDVPKGKEYINEFCTFNLGDAKDLAYVLPVDPAGSPPVTSGFLDTFARDVAVSYTHSGLVRSWTAKVDVDAKTVDFLLTCSVETGIDEPALMSGSSIRKAALVNAERSELTIWDIKGAQLEYSETFPSQEAIQDLDWTSTPDDQSILAVGFRHRVLLLSQLRYDYVNRGPAWTTIREINIRDYTPHPIGDSTWLGGGSLLVGAGNQLFVFDKFITVPGPQASALQLPHRKNGFWDLFEIVTRLNGPLPVFHPQFLSQCILAGKTVMVQRILLKLYQTLKYHAPDDKIDDLLGIDIEDFYAPSSEMTFTSQAARKEMHSSFADFDDADDPDEFTEAIAASLNEKLTTVDISQLSDISQMHLVDIVECVAMVEKQRRSMDDNAARFVLFHRQHALQRRRDNAMQLSWREVNWAYHSNSQDILLDVVSRQFHGRTIWENARESGMFMWITDAAALREQFEIIARNEYTKSDEKNPIDCSLFYLALKKKAVLQGLWRMAGWNREQSATQKLLSNNFNDAKWRTTALKNAYALLGKHRFEYAAAFFLLADSLRDAVNVCLNQLKDIQLAIALCRVYEGDHGPVLYSLLTDRILPLAAAEGNRWLASWAFWMLQRRDMAVRALISPVYTLLETPASPDMQAKLYLTDDPALVILYAQLRQKTLQTLRGASKVSPRAEWAFVMHSARLYDRMGCDILALDLVRNWEFLLQPPGPQKPLQEVQPNALLRRRSSLVVQDLPVREFVAPGSPGKAKKKAPTQFVEPEASSLLDSFGF